MDSKHFQLSGPVIAAAPVSVCPHSFFCCSELQFTVCQEGRTERVGKKSGQRFFSNRNVCFSEHTLTHHCLHEGLFYTHTSSLHPHTSHVRRDYYCSDWNVKCPQQAHGFARLVQVVELFWEVVAPFGYGQSWWKQVSGREPWCLYPPPILLCTVSCLLLWLQPAVSPESCLTFFLIVIDWSCEPKMNLFFSLQWQQEKLPVELLISDYRCISGSLKVMNLV